MYSFQTKIFFGIFLVAILASIPLPAQEYPVSDIPLELMIDADAIIREEMKHFEVKSEKAGKLYYRRAVTLLNEDSDADEMAVFYDSDSKVGKIRAWIYDARGEEIRRIDKNEIRDVAAVDGFSVYQDNRVKYFEAKQSDYPYTVVVEYEQELSGIAFAVFPDWYVPDYRTAVQTARFTIEDPGQLGFHYKMYNLEVEPEVSEDGRRYTWNIEGIPAVQKEPFSPNAGFVLPRILTSPERFQIEGYEGSMASWEDFGRFINTLYVGRDVLPPAIAAEVRRLTAGAVTDKEKIAVLYDYLQRNMRYVSVQLGIGGWQPFDAQYVGEKKFGDCKALTNFMKAMLREAGIEAYPVLIKSGELSYEVSEDFTTSRFNHVILYVPEEDTWLECTSSNFPPNYLGSSNAGRNVLLITPQGGRFHRTPDLDLTQNVETFDIDIELAATGVATVRVQQTSTGADHEWYRHMADHYSAEEQRKWLQQSSPLPSFSIESMQVAADPGRPVSELDYQVRVPRYAAQAGKRLFVPLNAVHPSTLVPEEVKERRLPVVRKRGYIERDTVRLLLPEGYQVESMPESPVTYERDFGAYRLELKKGEDALHMFRTLDIKSGEWPPERYGAFRDFFRDISKVEGWKIVLVEK